MSDRQFIGQLLLAYLVKKAAEAEPSPPSPPEAPSERRGFGLGDALAITLPGLAGGAGAGYAGYRYGEKPLRQAVEWLSDKALEYNENLARKMVEKRWPGHPALKSDNIGDVVRQLGKNRRLAVKYLRRINPARYMVPASVMYYLAERPWVRAGLAGLSGALAAGGLGQLIHSLAAKD